MKIKILTIFCEMFEGYLNSSITKRAREAGVLDVETIDIRSFSEDKHKKTDDYPFGGGAGLVMMPQPIFDAVEHAKQGAKNAKVIYMSPQGAKLDNKMAKQLANEDELIILCGHYEGVDQRVIDELCDMEISIGDYVLTGGELAAMVVTDSVMRFIPGAVGNKDVHVEESFEDGLLEYPQYTRPSDFRGFKVPDVLLSGHHKNIETWRRKKQLEKTKKLRPDLLESAQINKEDKKILSTFGDTEDA
jgi:tRNA (guanine37-N1)-methyltransferase